MYVKDMFDKTTLRGVALRNRFWRSATWLGLADEAGRVPDGIVRTYAELAAGCAAICVLLDVFRATDATARQRTFASSTGNRQQ